MGRRDAEVQQGDAGTVPAAAAAQHDQQQHIIQHQQVQQRLSNSCLRSSGKSNKA
jgi:hypothetical protein